ncbi:hypothetical protein LTR95_000631 [Oleoguttula sp. CCFEE 5521]
MFSESTVGYMDGREQGLWIKRPTEWRPDASPVGVFLHNRLVLAIAHELVHVFGLRHEHNRPNSYSFVGGATAPLKLNVASFDSYADAVKAMSTRAITAAALRLEVPGLPESIHRAWDQYNAVEKARASFVNARIARKYWPAVAAWGADPPENFMAWLGFYSEGQPFDYDSIMHYGSWAKEVTLMADGAMGHEDPPVCLDNRTPQKAHFYMGGNLNPELASISSGDIARPGAMYPWPVTHGLLPRSNLPPGSNTTSIRESAYTPAFEPFMISLGDGTPPEPVRPAPYTTPVVDATPEAEAVIGPAARGLNPPVAWGDDIVRDTLNSAST